MAGQRSILVVEDNELNMELLQAALEALGYACEGASGGEEAVAKAASGDFAVVLMDIALPTMDGTRAMRAIKALSREAPPVVAVTAFAMKGDRERYLGEGFDGYLAKPLDLDSLRREILRFCPPGAASLERA
jgi:CheY-like chemotaxis protein